MTIYKLTHPTQSTPQVNAGAYRALLNVNTIVVVTSLALGMLQGLLFSGVTTWVTERSYIIFNLLPFNLYPSDLIIIPFLIAYSLLIPYSTKDVRSSTKILHGYIFLVVIGFWQVAILAISYIDLADKNIMTFVTSGVFVLSIIPILMFFRVLLSTELHPLLVRWLLLLLWWSTWIVGFIHGLINGTVNLSTDIRELLLRPLVVLAICRIGSMIDFSKAAQWLIKVGILFSVISFMSGILKFTGLNLSNIIAPGLYGELGLLLPYSFALNRALTISPKGSANSWITVFILALGIAAPLSKPALGGFLICTILCIVITYGFSIRASKEIVKIALFIVLLICIMLVILSLTGGSDRAETYFRSAYLKQDWETQDLSGSRFSIWILGIETWSNSPINGWGMGYLLNGEILNLKFNRYVHSEIFWPHNFLIQMLYQIGIFGATLIVGLVFSWVVQAKHALAGQTTSTRWIHQSFITFALTIIGMSLYGQFIDQPISGFMLWVVLGLEAAYASSLHKRALT